MICKTARRLCTGIRIETTTYTSLIPVWAKNKHMHKVASSFSVLAVRVARGHSRGFPLKLRTNVSRVIIYTMQRQLVHGVSTGQPPYHVSRPGAFLRPGASTDPTSQACTTHLAPYVLFVLKYCVNGRQVFPTQQKKIKAFTTNKVESFWMSL